MSNPTFLDQLLNKLIAVNGVPLPPRPYLNFISGNGPPVDNPTFAVNGVVVGSTDVPLVGVSLSPATRGTQLALWLQGSTLTQSGGLVTTWPDSSGNWSAATPNAIAPAYTAVNAAYANQPTATYVHATGQQLLVTGFAVSQPNTIYIVGSDSFNPANMIDAASTRQILGFNSDWYFYAGSSVTSSNATAGPHAIAAVYNGASSALYIDNSATAAVTGNPGTNGISGGLFIGSSNAAANAMTGDIAEIVITNVADSLAQRQAMFHYFAVKYGLAVS